MLIAEADRAVVRWAIDRALAFDYCRPHCLPAPCLRVRMGMSTAFFHAGKLVHWSAEADGGDFVDLLQEMTGVFGMCTESRVHLSLHVRVEPPEQIVA